MYTENMVSYQQSGNRDKGTWEFFIQVLQFFYKIKIIQKEKVSFYKNSSALPNMLLFPTSQSHFS